MQQSPGRRWPAWLAAAGATIISGLRLVGRQCCAGRADAAWLQVRDRNCQDRQPGCG
jgi:hypothetical protein